ncbi:MAG: adenosine deaminase [Acidobacteria bacterium]|nr:adenosine deaminase [Acidobacteriota bacterium]
MQSSGSFPHILVLFLSTNVALAQISTAPEGRANRYLESIRRQPSLVLAFLREMPKGGDLHNHLGGSIYAEELIDYAVRDNLCLDQSTRTVVPGPCESCGKQASKPAVECGYRDPELYNSMIDAWSMRNWHPGQESGHDHFFASFSKFGLAMRKHTAEAIAAAMERAAADHLEYVELMHTFGGSAAAEVGARTGWNPDFAVMREQFLGGGIKEVVAAARQELDSNEHAIQEKLACQNPARPPACQVGVRYLYQVQRGLPPPQVFAQILTGFELASVDPRVTGLNLVMPEDFYVPMHDFHLHMKMLDFLHSIYPNVHISLHAGELAMGLVPPEGLGFHIRESIELGHAERIGHGVDVMNEGKPLELLKEMARRNVLVEICLTSNDVILGVRGDEHPFPIYRKYGVPVALATDDEGVSRSDMTHEYLRAAKTYGLSYLDLKGMARESLEHGFLPGASFWADIIAKRPVGACLSDRSESSGGLSVACRRFLQTSEKARLEWKLEQDFSTFEKRF